MFWRLPFDLDADVQQVALVLNTALLIAILITIEVLYAEAPTEKRQQLRYFFPLIIVVGGILLYAVFRQAGGA